MMAAQVAIFFAFIVSSHVASAPDCQPSLAQSDFFTNGHDL